MKNAKYLVKIPSLFFIGLLVVGFFMLSRSLSVSAASAPEGTCYEMSASSQGSTVPVDVSCGGDDPSPDCYLTVNSSAGPQKERVDCSSIQLPGAIFIDGTGVVSLNGDDSVGDDHYCGQKEDGSGWTKISFDIGCLGKDYDGGPLNPVLDMMFALLRFVSTGVGLIVIGSIIWAGIQYSASRGNPQTTEAAIKRVANSVIALLLYIFAYAILNFLVPGGLFL